MIKKVLVILLSASILIMTGCGGGGSSSGGSSLNGRYVGAVDFTLRLTNGNIVEDRVSAIITISGNSVTVSDSSRSASGSLDGSSFAVTLKFTTNENGGVTCNWKLLYNGKVDSAIVNGTVSGPITCSNGVNGSISGTFQAVKEAVAARQKMRGFSL